MKLNRRQRRVLDALSHTEWRKAPPLVRSQTLLALERRGLIEMRAPGAMVARLSLGGVYCMPSYTEYDLRLVAERSSDDNHA